MPEFDPKDCTDDPGVNVAFSDIKSHGDLGPLYAALAKARKAFRPIIKNRKQANPYPHEWADLQAIQEGITDALSDNGLVVLQPFSCNVAQGWLCITTRLAHSSGAYLETEARAIVSEGKGYAGIGSALSYIKRYSVTGLLSISPEDDDDAAQADNRPTDYKHHPPKAPSASQKAAPAPKPAKPVEPPKEAPAPDTEARPAIPPPAHVTPDTERAIIVALRECKDKGGKPYTMNSGRARIREIVGRETRYQNDAGQWDTSMTEAEGQAVVAALRGGQ